jgi:hypothetical protein
VSSHAVLDRGIGSVGDEGDVESSEAAPQERRFDCQLAWTNFELERGFSSNDQDMLRDFARV